MQRERDLWNVVDDDCPVKTHERDFTCGECGRTFQKPLLATVSTSGHTQTYYACPRCMTKAQGFKAPVKEKDSKAPALAMEQVKSTAEPQGIAKCGHFFGYLNKHQKNMAYPDECLTCARMVECLLHR